MYVALGIGTTFYQIPEERSFLTSFLLGEPLILALKGNISLSMYNELLVILNNALKNPASGFESALHYAVREWLAKHEFPPDVESTHFIAAVLTSCPLTIK
ncbi:MAG: hypothetical protein HXY22_12385 [Alphaproteobacteria bacterium]|nr:hypothetical protein [Alphaproteobacteria bacterium]